MFEALINGRIDTRGYEFDVTFVDIEELNGRVMGGVTDVTFGGRRGFDGGPDVSKVSYAVLPEIAERYRLLDSGSALGHGNGPVLVARRGFGRESDFIVSSDFRVAIPGIHTTANMLLQKLFPQLTDRRPMLFSDIAPAIAKGDVDMGVLIHEGRFTYLDHGLELVADLGVRWDQAMGGLPLPLGAIVASRSLPPEVVRDVEEMIRESVEYGFANPAASREFIKSHAQEMDDEVIDNHILLFVNDNSLSLGADARRAVLALTGVK
jgi:1,4-dihydroxy-6-naphthoate synthase